MKRGLFNADKCAKRESAMKNTSQFAPARVHFYFHLLRVIEGTRRAGPEEISAGLEAGLSTAKWEKSFTSLSGDD